MRLDFILIALISSCILYLANTDSAYSQEFIGEDDRVIVNIESLNRSNTFPEIAMPGRITSFSYSGEYYPPGPPPGYGKDFVIIYVGNVIEKKKLNVPGSERELTKTHLIDKRGKVHKILLKQSMGMAPRNDSAYLFFAMPRDATPAQLNYCYQYRDETSRFKNIKTGTLAIYLLNPKSETRNNQPVTQYTYSNPQISDSILFKNGQYYQREIRLKRSTIKNIVKAYPAAYQEVKSGTSRITWGFVLAGFGGISLGGGISTLIFGATDESLDPVSGISVGIACIAGSYLLIRSGAKRFVHGVEVYNSSLSSSTTNFNGVSIDFGLAENGIGFTIRF